MTCTLIRSNASCNHFSIKNHSSNANLMCVFNSSLCKWQKTKRQSQSALGSYAPRTWLTICYLFFFFLRLLGLFTFLYCMFFRLHFHFDPLWCTVLYDGKHSLCFCCCSLSLRMSYKM